MPSNFEIHICISREGHPLASTFKPDGTKTHPIPIPSKLAQELLGLRNMAWLIDERKERT